MFPRSAAQERRHRLRKRLLEIDLVLGHIRRHLAEPEAATVRRVLEFGIGSGFQLPHLQSFGEVTGLDQHIGDDVEIRSGVELVEGSITATPFDDGCFDLIYSNHVIEHIEDLAAAFAELRRIGKQNCLYAFSMPTNLWLVLAIPGNYYGRLRRLLHPRKTIALSGKRAVIAASVAESESAPPSLRRPRLRRLGRALALPAHGVITDFLPCYRAFRVSSWRKLFEDHGFKVEAVEPLLIYGPSQWPIIPILPPYRGLCSSVLVLLRK